MIKTKMYGILIDIFENDKYIRTETPAVNLLFKSEDEAYDNAYQMADDECTALNDGWVDSNQLISYGVVDQECNNGFISVNKYILESEYDDTGETEMLTKYRVIEFILEV